MLIVYIITVIIILCISWICLKNSGKGIVAVGIIAFLIGAIVSGIYGTISYYYSSSRYIVKDTLKYISKDSIIHPEGDNIIKTSEATYDIDDLRENKDHIIINNQGSAYKLYIGTWDECEIPYSPLLSLKYKASDNTYFVFSKKNYEILKAYIKERGDTL